MPRRTPPSTETLVEALRRYQVESGAPAERLIPVETAERVIVEAFGTNFATARRWIEAARRARAVYRVRTSEHGHPSVLTPRTDGTPGEWWGTMAQAGFGNDDTDLRFTVDRNGAWSAERLREELPEATWLATPDVLEHLAACAQQAWNASRVEHAADQLLTGATIQYMHADSVDVIRGLVDAVGLHTEPDRADFRDGWTNFDARVHRRGRGDEPDQVGVHLSLYGDDIDLLAEALRRLGIQPKPAD